MCMEYPFGCLDYFAATEEELQPVAAALTPQHGGTDSGKQQGTYLVGIIRIREITVFTIDDNTR